MVRKLTYLGLAGCLLLLVTSAAIPSPQEAQEAAKKGPAPKDTQEYELIKAAFDETDPQKKLAALDAWKAKYAETDYDVDRVRLYMVSYQQTNQGPKAIESAKELLSKVPGDFAAHYTIASLTPFLPNTTPDTMADGEKSAKALLSGGIDKQFQAANKPGTFTAEAWANAHKQTTATVYQTLGWIAMQRKEHVDAEKQFVASLKENPDNAQVSYWLGREVLNQADSDKNEMALFSFARAATLDGPGALTPQGKEQVNDYLVKVYTGYTGTEEGLDALKQMAMKQALPPADLKIESVEVRKYKEEQQRRKENPGLYKFIDLKNALLSANGENVWSKLRGSVTPSGLRLYVVSSDSARPTTIHLSSRRGGPVEVVLDLENRLRSAPGNGSLIGFEGVASSLTKSPFRLGLTDGKTLP